MIVSKLHQYYDKDARATRGCLFLRAEANQTKKDCALFVLADVSGSMGPLLMNTPDTGFPIDILRRSLELLLLKQPNMTLCVFSTGARPVFTPSSHSLEEKMQLIRDLKAEGETSVESAVRLLQRLAKDQKPNLLFLSDGYPTRDEVDPAKLADLLPSMHSVQFATIGKSANYKFFQEAFRRADGIGICIDRTSDVPKGIGAMLSNANNVVAKKLSVHLQNSHTNFDRLVAGDEICVPYETTDANLVAKVTYQDSDDQTLEEDVLIDCSLKNYAQEDHEIVLAHHLKKNVQDNLILLRHTEDKVRLLYQQSLSLCNTKVKEEIQDSIHVCAPGVLLPPTNLCRQATDSLAQGRLNYLHRLSNPLVRQQSEDFACRFFNPEEDDSVLLEAPPKLTRS